MFANKHALALAHASGGGKCKRRVPYRSERSGEGGAKRRSAQAKRGRLGCLLRAPEAEPLPCLPCLLSMVRRRGFTPCITAGAFGRFLWQGNRATISDSRSNFHTRVGYRTNVCRRRLASDLARASDLSPAQGALEDHHDRSPGSPNHRARSISYFGDVPQASSVSANEGPYNLSYGSPLCPTDS